VHELERSRVFGNTWQFVSRVDQLAEMGSFITADVAGEPILVARGDDGSLRAFYNVCRHHAARVEPRAEGTASRFRCPYHGWTYALDGSLKALPGFDGVEDFDKSRNGLCPLRVETWEQFVFVCGGQSAPALGEYLGDLTGQAAPLGISKLKFAQRRTYDVRCNWKVFVDNFLDGGYHVPYIHKGLNSVISYKDYRIECGERFCVQSSPLVQGGGQDEVAKVRGGTHAYYFWVYPNFMLNCYKGYADVNVVLPAGVDRCVVLFDFYFAPGEGTGGGLQDQSINVADVVQQEDIDICESVQRGLSSRSYDVGRLSVEREAGEHLFHRLLARGLRDEPAT